MKKIITRSIVLLAIVALVFGSLPTDSAQAAKKKSKTSITVSTQEELVKALKSGKYKKITIKTDAKVSFTLASKYSNSDLKIVVDAKNATFNSKGTVGSIVVNEAKTVKEYASGNNITVNDEKLTFKAMEGASVEKLKIASETGEVKVVNNGEIGRVDVTGESKVDVEQNGSVGRLYVAAAAEIGVTGTSEEKLAVTVKPEAAGAAVKSELPVKVNAYADVDLQLEKGAENSAVTLKNEDAGVKLENNTDKKVTVTDSDGEKQTVKKGEDLTSDNYVGKPDEPETTEGTVTEQPKEEEQKEEEKKEEEKEEEKKDDTTTETVVSGGDSSGGGSYPTPQEQLQTKLTAASNGTKEAKLTQDLTLTKELIIPSGVCLVLDGHTLNAGSFVTLEPDASIWVTPWSNLIVDNDPFEFVADDGGFTHAELTLEVDGVIKIGDYSIRGMGSEFDPIATRIIIENRLKKEMVPEDPNQPVSESNPEVALNFTERNVRFDYMGKSFDIFTESGTYNNFAKVFGGNRAYWVDDQNLNLEYPQTNEVLTTLEINPLSNVLYDSRKVTFNGQPIYSTTVGIEDWINAYLDPGMNWSAFKAVEQGKEVPSSITVPQSANDPMVVTVTDNDIHFTKNVYVRKEATLIAHNIVYDQTQPVAGPLGGDFQNAPGIRVAGKLIIDSITSAGFYGDNQELIKMQGANSTLKLGNDTYTIVTDNGWLNDPECHDTPFSYVCWNYTNQYYGFQLYTWDFNPGFTIKKNDVDAFKHPVNGELVPKGTPIVAEDSDQLWVLANATSQWGAREFWDGANNISNENLSDYDEYAKGWLDFLEATLESKESVDAQYGNKKPVVVTPVEQTNEDGSTYTQKIVELCGMKLVVDNDTTFVLADTFISISRGANLVVRSISCDKTQGAGLCLDNAARVDLSYGGKLTIGDIVFQCANHGGGDGNYTVSFDVIGDNPKKIRLQIGEDVIIKKTDGTVLDVTAINNLGFEIQFCDANENEPYFHSIKLNGKYVFADMGGRLVEGNYTMSNETTDQYGDKHADFETDSIAGLKAIWRLSADYSAETYDPSTRRSGVIWANVNYTGANNVEFEHICMDLPATITFRNASNIHLANNAKLQASVRIVSGSAITVGSGCKLATTMGSDTIIAGRLEVQNGEQGKGTVVSQMGSNLVIATGGAFELNGTFECGGIKLYNDKTPAYEVGVWFVNEGGTVSGNGNIIVTIVNTTDVALTDEEKTNIRNYVLTAINNNANISITINEVKDNPEQ